MSVCGWCRPGSVIADLGVDFSTNVTDDFIKTITPVILRNLMDMNNTFNIDGVDYPAAIDTIYGREVPQTDGSLPGVGIIACRHIIQLLLFHL